MRPVRRFTFRLAAQLGCTVDELLHRITSRELTEWIAYDSLEPVGAVRGDVHAALIAATVANCHRSSKRPAFKLADFMPFRARRDEPRGDMAAAFAALRAVARPAGRAD